MKVVSRDPENAATVDEQAYGQFCRQLGIPLRALEELEIRFVLTIPGKPQARAEFKRTVAGISLIRLCTLNLRQQRYSTGQLNAYLLHETKHFSDFIATGRCHAPAHLSLSHDERPAEQMARAFVGQHKHQQLIQER